MIQKISGNLRQEQAAATRAKLLESAKRLFAEHGYKGTSVRMINRSVGLADGLLYHYFPDGKKEIFQAVVEQQLSQLMDVLDGQYTADSYAEIPLEQALEKIYRIFVREMEERLDLFRILFRENEVRGLSDRRIFSDCWGAGSFGFRIFWKQSMRWVRFAKWILPWLLFL